MAEADDQTDALAGNDRLIDLDDVRNLDVGRRLQALASHQRGQRRRAALARKQFGIGQGDGV